MNIIKKRVSGMKLSAFFLEEGIDLDEKWFWEDS